MIPAHINWTDTDQNLKTSGTGEFGTTLVLSTGTTINEFSVDDTMAGDSDDAVPTEQAVKAYVDGAAGGTLDHGLLTGRGDDDHTQYLLADGSRALAGAWDMDSQNLTNVDIDSGTIDGVTIGTNSACTQLVVDNIALNGNTITCTGDLVITASGGDIDAGDDNFKTTGAVWCDQFDLSDAAGKGVLTDLVPTDNNTKDLGNSSYKWKDLYLSGDIFCDDDITCDELTITNPGQNWKWSGDASGNFYFQGLDSDANAVASFYKGETTSKTKATAFRTWALGGPSAQVNRQFMQIGYDATRKYEIYIYRSGTGVLEPFSIFMHEDPVIECVKVDTGGEIYFQQAVDDALGNLRDTYWDSTSGQIGYDSSSIKTKENIRDINDCLWIYNLRPVKYDLKDANIKDRVGLIAEEVGMISSLPNSVLSYKRLPIVETYYDDVLGQETTRTTGYEITDEVETVNKSQLIVPLLKEVQRLRAELDELKLRNRG